MLKPFFSMSCANDSRFMTSRHEWALAGVQAPKGAMIMGLRHKPDAGGNRMSAHRSMWYVRGKVFVCLVGDFNARRIIRHSPTERYRLLQ